MEIIKRITAFLAIFTVTLWIVLSPSPSLPQEKQCIWEVYFSPYGGCTDAIIRELNKAKSTMFVQAHSFTSAPIARALLNAYKRGVKEEIILGKSQKTDDNSSATFLFNAGTPVKIDAAEQYFIIGNESSLYRGLYGRPQS